MAKIAHEPVQQAINRYGVHRVDISQLPPRHTVQGRCHQGMTFVTELNNHWTKRVKPTRLGKRGNHS